MTSIKIASHMRLCLADKEGMVLRNLIDANFIANERVVLDFSGISVYASPFFNVSLGYFIGKYGIEKYNNVVEIKNLSPVGEKVYQIVSENAVKYFESNRKNEIDTIVQNTDK